MSPCGEESVCILEWAKPVMVPSVLHHLCSTAVLSNQTNHHERKDLPTLLLHLLPQENTNCNIRRRDHCRSQLIRTIPPNFVFQDTSGIFTEYVIQTFSIALISPPLDSLLTCLTLPLKEKPCEVRDLPITHPVSQSLVRGLARSWFTMSTDWETDRLRRKGEGQEGEKTGKEGKEWQRQGTSRTASLNSLKAVRGWGLESEGRAGSPGLETSGRQCSDAHGNNLTMHLEQWSSRAGWALGREGVSVKHFSSHSESHTIEVVGGQEERRGRFAFCNEWLPLQWARNTKSNRVQNLKIRIFKEKKREAPRITGEGECDNEPRWEPRKHDLKKNPAKGKEETRNDCRNGGMKVT